MMGGLAGYLFVYILGGLSFLPLLLAIAFLHAWFTFPIHNDTAYLGDGASSIIQSGDDVGAIKRAQKTLGEKFVPSNNEADVAAGYFAVSREYTPGMEIHNIITRDTR
jgi:hypothetical protein